LLALSELQYRVAETLRDVGCDEDIASALIGQGMISQQSAGEIT